ncbi:MAG: translation initiation factor IF-2 [Bacteroidota bacterium]
MAEGKTIRLSQAARKLNVGTATLIEHMAKNGFEVENKPNTKIPLDQFDALVEVFSGAATDKEEAAELTIGQKYAQSEQLTAETAAVGQFAAKHRTTVPTLPGVTVSDKAALVSKKASKRILASPEAAQVTIAAQGTAGAQQKITAEEQESLKGLTVLGKMELSKAEEKEFRQAAYSSDGQEARKKRFRKRIAKPADTVKRTKEGVSEQEIQEQIKSTLARLGGVKSPIGNRAKYKREKRSAMAEAQEEARLRTQEEAKTLQVTEFVSANDLASLMGVPVNEVLSTCMSLGLMVSINQRLDAEAITVIADEFGYNVAFIDVKDEEEEVAEEDPSTLVPRAPIVTIMGHVDHGKTSLLDYIRNTKIAKGEAGGITQHIGAYDVVTEGGKRIAFLDTPGHEAFTAMRARGAKITDVAIIVIAADDQVMPQTKEAISHAQAAEVPIVIAFNKIDKPQANVDKIKEELSGMNIMVEDWGGKYQSQAISAKTGEGVEALLEKVLLEAELLELKANPDKKAYGTVLEASLDQGRGYVTTTMVQSGTLRTSDVVIAGAYYGRVKAMNDHRGQRVHEVLPATPVQVLGLNGAPQAGDALRVMNTEKEARELATHRQQILREQGIRTKTHITLDEIGRRLAIGSFKELNIIIKGDVDGSVEALSDSLLKLSTEEIQVNVIHKSVGAISESDILLASAADAIVIGFQVRPSVKARQLAEREGIDIRLYSIIYDAINNVKDAMQGMLAPTIEEIITGNAAVKEVFKITKVGTVAGCYVTDGYLKRSNKIRLIRDGIVVYTGNINQLKRFKEDVSEVKHNFECGISIEKFNDVKVDDVIEGFEEKEVARTL